MLKRSPVHVPHHGVDGPDDRDHVGHHPAPRHPLRVAVHAMVRRCLFDPARVREYQLALFTACLGALKFPNLDRRAKHRLYLTAAYLGLTL